MREKDPLELDTRNKIYDYVKNNPGVYLRQVQKFFSMPLGTAVYHLQYLEKAELITCEESDGYKRYYARGTYRLRDKQILALLRQPTPRKILIYLIMEKGLTHKELTQRLAIAPSTLSFHLGKLVKSGLIVKEVMGKEHHYSAEDPEEIAKLLIQHKSSFIDDVVERFVEAWGDLNP